MNQVKEAFLALVQQGAIAKANLIGCTDEEILIIQKHFSCQLPQAYKDFLLIAGKGAGILFRGSDIFYPRVLELQSEAKELLSELGLTTLLPIDAKVFCMHQGYELNYFMPTSDDPPVFQFFEGEINAFVAWESFSKFIKASIQSHLGQWPDVN